MDKLLSELGYSKISYESKMTTGQALDKMFLDITCNMDYKDVIKAYVCMR